MFSTSIFHLALLATSAATASATSAIVEQTEAGLPYTLGKPTFFGSGCPSDTVAVVSSSDAKTISVLFSDFGSKTTSSRMRQYKACSLAVPLDVKPVRCYAYTMVYAYAVILIINMHDRLGLHGRHLTSGLPRQRVCAQGRRFPGHLYGRVLPRR
jgi:hypothetical protein